MYFRYFFINYDYIYQNISENKVDIDLIRQDKDDPGTHEEAMALLRINVKSQDPKLVGRIFTAKVVELALAN